MRDEATNPLRSPGNSLSRWAVLEKAKKKKKKSASVSHDGFGTPFMSTSGFSEHLKSSEHDGVMRLA